MGPTVGHAFPVPTVLIEHLLCIRSPDMRHAFHLPLPEEALGGSVCPCVPVHDSQGSAALGGLTAEAAGSPQQPLHYQPGFLETEATSRAEA